MGIIRKNSDKQWQENYLMKHDYLFGFYLVGGVVFWFLSALFVVYIIVPDNHYLPISGYMEGTLVWIIWMVGLFISRYRMNHGYEGYSSFSKKFNILTIVVILFLSYLYMVSITSYSESDTGVFIITFFLMIINSIHFWIVKSKNGSKSKWIWFLMIINLIGLVIISNI